MTSKLNKLRALKELIKTKSIHKEEMLIQLKDLIVNSNLNNNEIKELEVFYTSLEKYNALKEKLEGYKINIEKKVAENTELKRILTLDNDEIKKIKDLGYDLLQ